ncbi:hypothetical protein H4R34_001602 [Dimargaris verticillata]|uniref:WD repeat-containing protein 44 n=1 Tax=Dimargaris verticillata TaxID=2761393 RepID=A0A9W8EAS4_9FUNG|nr:hypothetical protein H4R34_001602 [Dimargaris verticillata]
MAQPASPSRSVRSTSGDDVDDSYYDAPERMPPTADAGLPLDDTLRPKSKSKGQPPTPWQLLRRATTTFSDKIVGNPGTAGGPALQPRGSTDSTRSARAISPGTAAPPPPAFMADHDLIQSDTGSDSDSPSPSLNQPAEHCSSPPADALEKRKKTLSFGSKKFLDKLNPLKPKPLDAATIDIAPTAVQPRPASITSSPVTHTPMLPAHSSDRNLSGHVRSDGTIAYTRVRARHKPTRLLHRLFLAQEVKVDPDTLLPPLSPVPSRYPASQGGSHLEPSISRLSLASSRTHSLSISSAVPPVPGRPPVLSQPAGSVPPVPLQRIASTHSNMSVASLPRSPLPSPRHSTVQSRTGTGPHEPVFCLKFSQNGQYLATGGQNAIVKVWQLRDHTKGGSPTNSESHRAKPDANDDARSVSHSLYSYLERTTRNTNPDANPATDAGSKTPEDHDSPLPSQITADSVGIFEDMPYREYTGHTRDILDLSWSRHNFLLSSSMDKTVRLWHVSRSECLCCFHHIDFVTSIAFHPRDDRFFLSGSLDGKVRLWNIPEKKVASWNEMPDGHFITAVGFASKEGTLVAAGSHRGLCVFYDTDGLQYHTQIQVRSTRGRNARGHKITGIEAMPSTSFGEDKLLITSNDSRIRLYNMKDKSLERKYKGHTNTSSQIKATFSADGKRIICGSEDHNVYVWDTQPSVVQKSVYKDKVYYTQTPMLLGSTGGAGTFKKRDRDHVGMEWFAASSHIITAAIFAPPETIQWLAKHGDPLLTQNPRLALRTGATAKGDVPRSTTAGLDGTGATDSQPPGSADQTSIRSNGASPKLTEGGKPLSKSTHRSNSSTSLLTTGIANNDLIITTGYDGIMRVFRCDTRSESVIAAQSFASRNASQRSVASRMTYNPNASSVSVLSGLSFGPVGMSRSSSRAGSEASSVHVTDTTTPISGTHARPGLGQTSAVAAPLPKPTSTGGSPRRHHAPSLLGFLGLSKKKPRDKPLGSSYLVSQGGALPPRRRSVTMHDQVLGSLRKAGPTRADSDAALPRMIAPNPPSQLHFKHSTQSLTSLNGSQTAAAAEQSSVVSPGLPRASTGIEPRRRSASIHMPSKHSVESKPVTPAPKSTPRASGRRPRVTITLHSSLRQALTPGVESPPTTALPGQTLHEQRATPSIGSVAHPAPDTNALLSSRLGATTVDKPASSSDCPKCQSNQLQVFDVLSSTASGVPSKANAAASPPSKITICLSCRSLVE